MTAANPTVMVAMQCQQNDNAVDSLFVHVHLSTATCLLQNNSSSKNQQCFEIQKGTFAVSKLRFGRLPHV